MFGSMCGTRTQTARLCPGASELRLMLRASAPAAAARVALAARAMAKKKGGGKKDGGNPLKGKKSLVPEKKVTLDPTTNTMVIMHSLQVIESYRKAADAPILQGLDIAVAAKALFDAPFALVTSTADEEPKVDYANKMALEALGYTWDDAVALTMAATMPEAGQGAWAEAVAKMDDAGLTPFGGPLVTQGGEELAVDGAQGWAIKTMADAVIGHAVKWSLPSAEREGEAETSEPEMTAAELTEAVAAQGSKVRELKSSEDASTEEIKAQVDVLLALKARLAAAEEAEGEAPTAE